MELVDLYIKDREHAKHMVSLCEFMDNIKMMDMDERIARRVETFISKRSMHGVPNVWPFNVIKYVDEKDTDQTITLTDTINSIVDNREVNEFVKFFGMLIKAEENLRKLKLKIAKVGVEILHCKGWWEGGDDDRVINLCTENQATISYVEAEQVCVKTYREECNRILAKVFLNETSFVLRDGDGDKFVPEKISIRDLSRRVPK